MKIFMTGAGGMLGTDMVRAIGTGHEWLGVGITDADHLDIQYEKIDLSDAEAALKVTSGFKPDIIFHLAAMTHVDGCESKKAEAERANVDVTRNMVECANSLSIPLVFFSTDFVFDGESQEEYQESDRPNPLSVYGHTKWMAENVVRENALQYVIFRISWLYGLYGQSFPRAILKQADKTSKLKVVADQIGRPTYTGDIADMFRQLFDQDEKIFHQVGQGIFHLGNAGTASWHDFASEILALAGYDQHEVDRITSDELDRPARRPKHSVLSLNKLEKTFGIRFRHWKEAVKEFIPQLQEDLKSNKTGIC